MASLSQKQQQQQQQQQRAISPHRTVVWTEQKPNKSSVRRKAVPVVYYLCREDGQLEHPHFMEVSSSDGRLCLRDFTERLDMLRGKGMAAMYSWSSKRSYRNQGFVWHDLTEDDIIHPAHANEYVLKGSHRFSSSFFSSHGRRRNWSSFDLAEYKHQHQHQQVSSQATDEISPPPSSSSPNDTLDVRATAQKKEVIASVRMRASSVLMQLISCSSVTVKKSHSHQKNKIPAASPSLGCSSAHHEGGEWDYFSGSLIDETSNNNNNKTTAAALKRSSSCNAGT